MQIEKNKREVDKAQSQREQSLRRKGKLGGMMEKGKAQKELWMRSVNSGSQDTKNKRRPEKKILEKKDKQIKILIC